jgi:hypothetical protein
MKLFSAEVKNVWSFTQENFSLLLFTAVYLVHVIDHLWQYFFPHFYTTNTETMSMLLSFPEFIIHHTTVSINLLNFINNSEIRTIAEQ